MAYGKMQSGDWIVAGPCGEPRLTRVGKQKTPRCTIGIAAGQSQELDDNGKPKTIWINVTAWRKMAVVLNQAHSGDAVLVIGKLHSHEYEGKRYKDVQAVYVNVSQPEFYDEYAVPPAIIEEPAAMVELWDVEDGALPF